MTIFSKIIAGEIPCYKIAENEKYIGFLDIMPSQIGHTLVVPKIETDRLFDLPDDFLDGYLTFCKPIANAIRKAFNADRVNIITIGFEVPHAHIHLVPMNITRDFDIISQKIKLSDEEMRAVQQKIIDAIEG